MAKKKLDDRFFITSETKMIKACFRDIFKSVIHHDGRVLYSESPPFVPY